MKRLPRREFLRRSAAAIAGASAASVLPPAIGRALNIPAAVRTGTIQDVEHIVILMLENRSFDHYFGTMQGVRGFGDPFPINLPSGKPVWYQSNGSGVTPPYHLNSANTSALLVQTSPHTYSDTQAAWNQGILDRWPLYKTEFSMGHYQQNDIPFQFALAQAFTICDAYHCSLTGGTEPNRVWFFSSSGFNTRLAAAGTNCGADNAIVNNGRCEYLSVDPPPTPLPGYVYNPAAGAAFTDWLTLPEVMQNGGVSWRIYQDVYNNGMGTMHGGLAFENFRKATSAAGGPLYEYGMTSRSLAQLQADAANGRLPEVSWILPPGGCNEHPSESSPAIGANFVSQVLDAITANPDVWARTALFITYDENDGFFDHVPAPAVPSYNADGTLAGAATMNLAGEYFDTTGTYLDSRDTISGPIRPYGMGPRVPMYVISPWSRGGWVNSQVFDHTSIALFLEKRFGVRVESISPWHRAIAGDLTSAFDFANPNANFPVLPDTDDFQQVDAEQATLPPPDAPTKPEPLYQATGVRPSRALPYVLAVNAAISGSTIALSFVNSGSQGVVFHVYDQLHLNRIPRRYTVEAGKSLTGQWNTSADKGSYRLWVYGPNGFVRFFEGNAQSWVASNFRPEIQIAYATATTGLALAIENRGPGFGTVQVSPNKYAQQDVALHSVPGGGSIEINLSAAPGQGWYDFTVASVSGSPSGDFERRFAGRIETGADGVSDPAMASGLS